MCVIASLPKGKTITNKTLDQMWKRNPDGGGISWIEKDRNVDVFDIKKDLVQTLVEAGYNHEKFFIDSDTPNYYHPGKSGRLFLNCLLYTSPSTRDRQKSRMH